MIKQWQQSPVAAKNKRSRSEILRERCRQVCLCVLVGKHAERERQQGEKRHKERYVYTLSDRDWNIDGHEHWMEEFTAVCHFVVYIILHHIYLFSTEALIPFKQILFPAKFCNWHHDIGTVFRMAQNHSTFQINLTKIKIEIKGEFWYS